jgi:hypothetical protein
MSRGRNVVRRRRACFAASIVSLTLAASSAHAASVTWNVAGGGSWDTTSNNWIGGSPNPSRYVNGDNATFNNTAGGTITLANSLTPNVTTVSASSGTYTFAGAGVTNGFELRKTGFGRLVITSLFNAFALAVTVENAGGVSANGSGAHLTLDCPTGPALISSLNIGTVFAPAGNIAKVNLNRSEQILDISNVYFGSPAGQYAYFSIRGHTETIASIITANQAATGGAIENGNLNAAINTDGSLILAPIANTAYTFNGIIRDADVGGGTGKLNITVNGPGTQILGPDSLAPGPGGTYTYTGATTINGGTLQLNNDGATSAWNPVLNNAGADIRGGRLVFDYNGTTSPKSIILLILDSGYDQATKFSSGKLRTSNAADARKGLGWIDDTSAKQLSIAYTYYGDGNLDGVVNSSDFSTLAANFNGAAETWAQGDFNYDGTVNALDFNVLANNFGQPLLPTSALGTILPEPSMLGICLIGASIRRRRRREPKQTPRGCGKHSSLDHM